MMISKVDFIFHIHKKGKICVWVVQKTKKTKEYIFRARILIWPFYFNQDLCVMKAKAVESFKEVEICQKSIPIIYYQLCT